MTIVFLFSLPLKKRSRDRRGLAPPSGIRSGHSYGHVYGGAYEDDYSISQHQARTTAAAAANGRPATATMSSTTSSAVVAPAERNGKTSAGRYQDPAPRAWGDGGSGPRYVASPTHSTTATSPSVSASTSAAAAAAAAGSPSAPLPADYERPPPYYYPGPA